MTVHLILVIVFVVAMLLWAFGSVSTSPSSNGWRPWPAFVAVLCLSLLTLGHF